MADEENFMVNQDQAAPMEAPPQQNLLSQDQVNKIVAREKARALENGRRQAEQEYQQKLGELEAARSQQQQTNAGQSREVDSDAIYKQVQERFNKEMEERRLKDQMTQVANNYLQKVAQGKEAYEDFDTVTQDFDPTAFPQLTFLLSGIDNAADVLYDLSKNPLKLAGIDQLAGKNPRQANAELLKLSRSILENRQAQNEAQGQNVAEPLDRLRPSRIAGSNGKMGISDLRNQDWLRG